MISRLPSAAALQAKALAELGELRDMAAQGVPALQRASEAERALAEVCWGGLACIIRSLGDKLQVMFILSCCCLVVCLALLQCNQVSSPLVLACR